MVKAEGAVSIKASVATMKSLAADENFDPHYDIIVDLRKMELQFYAPNPLMLKDTLISMKSAFRASITIVQKETALAVAKIISTMAAVHGMTVKVVTNSPILDRLEADN